MSWSAVGIIHSELAEYESVSNVHEVPEHKQQYDVAIAAVRTIIASGALGPRDGKYRIYLSGHGNPGHEPKEGWANDSIGISLHRMVVSEHENLSDDKEG